MKLRFIEDLKQTFESSSGPTEQFLSFCRIFRNDFKKYLESLGATNIVIDRGHFDVDGFFTMGSQAWWFSISDLRWSKDEMLVRTAKDYKDFTGGQNQYASLSTQERFEEDMHSILKLERAQMVLPRVCHPQWN